MFLDSQLHLLNSGNQPSSAWAITPNPCATAWKLLQGNNLRQSLAHLNCFPSLGDHDPLFPVVQCLENHCLMYNVHLQIFQVVGKSRPYYSILVRSRSLTILLKHELTYKLPKDLPILVGKNPPPPPPCRPAHFRLRLERSVPYSNLCNTL